MAHKITNPNYRKFLDEGLIDPINEEQIRQALDNMGKKRSKESRVLLIVAYYTGARPVEYLRIRGKNIKKQGRYITIFVEGAKGGLPRTIFFPAKLELIKEAYEYATGVFPEMLLFPNFINKYTRKVQTKRGITEHEETTDKLRYYFKIWFAGVVDNGISPYFLRHNRFSKLTIAGASDRDLQTLKGCKDPKSLRAYQHMSTASSKRVARFQD